MQDAGDEPPRNSAMRSSENFFSRDCMKTPDMCRTGTPPSAENGPTGLYFGVSCYRRPTIRASPTTFHTVSYTEFYEVRHTLATTSNGKDTPFGGCARRHDLG